MSSSLTPLPLHDVLEIAGNRKRRRARARAAAASAVAVAGLGAAGIAAVYTFGPGQGIDPFGPAAQGPTSQSADGPSAATSVEPSLEPGSVPGIDPDSDPGSEQPPSAASTIDPAVISDQESVDVFFLAGYSADDAMALANAWNLGVDTVSAKVKAGRSLAQGVSLSDSPYVDPTLDDGFTATYLGDYFLSSGYTFADARTLATQWGLPLSQAKVRAGSELKVVGVLPFVEPVVEADTAALTVYWAVGCNADDAVILAQFWGMSNKDLTPVKVRAGELLRSGQPLPGTTPSLTCTPGRP